MLVLKFSCDQLHRLHMDKLLFNCLKGRICIPCPSISTVDYLNGNKFLIGLTILFIPEKFVRRENNFCCCSK